MLTFCYQYLMPVFLYITNKESLLHEVSNDESGACFEFCQNGHLFFIRFFLAVVVVLYTTWRVIVNGHLFLNCILAVGLCSVHRMVRYGEWDC